MAKLTKAQRDGLASIINSLYVSTFMREEAQAKGDRDGVRLWHDSIQQDTLKLFEKYGIELPFLSFIQENNAA